MYFSILEINECLSNPCGFNGQCSNEVNGFSCECNEGFSGDLCQMSKNACASNPCFEGVCREVEQRYYIFSIAMWDKLFRENEGTTHEIYQ